MKQPVKILFLLLLIAVTAKVGSAQITAPTTSHVASIPGVLETYFLRDSMSLDEKGFAFNTLTLKNISAKKTDIVITADLKEKIQSVNPIPQNISLAPGETKVLPLRFSLSNAGVITGVYQMHFDFSIISESKTVSNEFSIRIQRNTKWKSAVDKTLIIFKGQETALPIKINIENRGNADEEFELSLELPEQLKARGLEKKVLIASGKSKVVEIFIENSDQPGKPIILTQGTVSVFIKNVGGENRKYNVELVKLGNIYTENISTWKKMPLSVELNINNLANANPFAFARVYGTVDLNARERVRVYYQSDNYFRDNISRSAIGFAEYSNKNLRIHAGSIQEFNVFQVDGLGLKLGYKSANSFTEAFVVQGREKANEVAGFSNISSLGKKWSNNLQSFYYNDHRNLLRSSIVEDELGYAIDKHTQFGIIGGYSIEQTSKKILPEKQSGSLMGYNFEHTGATWNYSSQVKLYSDAYAGFNKGFHFQQHKVKYQLNDGFLQASVDLNKRAQSNYGETDLLQLFSQDTKTGSLTYGFFRPKGSFSFGPSYLLQKQDSIDAYTAKSALMNANIFVTIADNFIFSIVSQTGFTTIPKTLYPKPIFLTSNFGSVNYKTVGLQYRVDYGPIYYYEVSEFIKNPTVNTLRYQLSPYVDLAIPKWHISTRFQYTINREKINNTKDDYLYHQLQWKHPKNKWELFLTGQYNTVESKRTFVNVSYRRVLNVPVLRNKNLQNASFVFYKDINNNGGYDQGDMLLEDMQVFVNKNMLLTDKAGSVLIKNTDDNILNMDFSASNNTQGWIPLNGLKQTFTLNGKNNKQFVAFKKGKSIKGVIVLVKDANSTLDFSVANIRVTAESSDGMKYTAISNDKGEFYFNVVSGTYLISLPQVFDDVFRPTEFAKNADLINNEAVSVSFEVKQKKRNVNIKKN